MCIYIYTYVYMYKHTHTHTHITYECELRGRRYVHHSSVNRPLTDCSAVDYRQYYSNTRGSIGNFQFNVPSSRQYIPLYNLKKMNQFALNKFLELNFKDNTALYVVKESNIP